MQASDPPPQPSAYSKLTEYMTVVVKQVFMEN